MKNTLSDLNNHLFTQLEKLNDDDLQGEELEREIKRSESMGQNLRADHKNRGAAI